MKGRTLLVLLSFLGGAGAEDDDAAAPETPSIDLPEKARLSPGRRKYKMRRNWPLPPDVVEAENPGMRKGKVEKLEVWFFDVDGDGVYGEVDHTPFRTPCRPTSTAGRSPTCPTCSPTRRRPSSASRT